MAKPPSQQTLNVVSHGVSHLFHPFVWCMAACSMKCLPPSYWNPSWIGQPAMNCSLEMVCCKSMQHMQPHVHSSSIQVGYSVSMLFNSYKLLPSGNLT